MTEKTIDITPLNKPFDDVRKLRARIEQIETVAICCNPFTSLDVIPPMYRVSERWVQIRTAQDGKRFGQPYFPDGEIYRSKLYHGDDPNAVSLTALGIERILSATGASVEYTRILDDGSDGHLVEREVCLVHRQLDGVEVKRTASCRLDFRPGSTEIAGLSEGQVKAMRSKIVQRAETGALSRAARKLAGLRPSYNINDLETKPFICFALVPHVDISDPVIARMAAAQALGITRQLYGAGPVDAGQLNPAPAQVELLPDGREVEIAQPAMAGDDFEIPEVDDEPQGVTCDCECGCSDAVPEDVAAKTIERAGAILCGDCFPGPRFDFKKHDGVDDLKIPNRPGLTVAKLSEFLAARGAK